MPNSEHPVAKTDAIQTMSLDSFMFAVLAWNPKWLDEYGNARILLFVVDVNVAYVCIKRLKYFPSLHSILFFCFIFLNIVDHNSRSNSYNPLNACFICCYSFARSFRVNGVWRSMIISRWLMEIYRQYLVKNDVHYVIINFDSLFYYTGFQAERKNISTHCVGKQSHEIHGHLIWIFLRFFYETMFFKEL